MRLNIGKCKMLAVNIVPPVVTINGVALDPVITYKYLGVDLNTQLDPSEQWQRVYTKLAAVPFVLKELKLTGFTTSQLVNFYRAYALAHFDYSAVILTSCTETVKKEMASYQSNALNIIGISQTTASTRYRIKPILQRIDDTCTRILKRIIADPTHPITSELRVSTIQTRSASSCKFDVPKASTEAYRGSFLLTYLRKERDGCHDQYTNDGTNRNAKK